MKRLIPLVGALLLTAVTAGPAHAHVGTSSDEAPAGGSLDLGLTIGHGCDGSPTRQILVQIPEGVNSASAYFKPGWTVDVQTEELDPPIEGAHGDTIDERTDTITFTATAGNELPNNLRDTFTVRFTAPDEAGERLFFKTVQRCIVGENAWIEEFDGEGEEPDSPAPAVLVVASDGGDDHGDGDGVEGDSEDGEASEDAAAPASDDDSDSAMGIAIAGLVAGILGLATGGIAFVRSRRSA